MKNILVVAAHPDDETLGCGGTLLLHRANGCRLHWLIATQAGPPDWSQSLVRKKELEVKKVSAAYGMASVHRLGFPSTMLDRVSRADLMERVRQVIAKSHPQVVYVVHPGDVHSDHRELARATFSVIKAFRLRQLGIQRVLCYETLSSTEALAPGLCAPFVPNVYQNITPMLKRKIEILHLYRTEEQGGIFPRSASSVGALARYRGATVGVKYAEAFALMHEVLG